MSDQPQAQDQFQYIKLPDGSYGKFAAGASDDVIRGAIQKDFPDAFGPPDNRNGFQKSVDSATAAPTVQDEAGRGPIGRAFDKFGAGASHGLLSPIAHPVEALKGAFQPSEFEGAIPGGVGNPITSMVLNGIKGTYDDYKQNGLPYALGDLAGNFALGDTAGRTVGAGSKALQPAFRDIKERIGGYDSPVIDPNLQNSSKLAKSIRPPGGISHGFEQDLATNMPLIRAFADETGNPLHSQWEGATAARGLAQRGLEHFNTKFLEPNATRTVPINDIPDYQGASSEGMTSIRDINKRLSDINDMLRPAGNAKTMGAEMTAQQRLGLGAEAGKLRQILYDKLGESSGVSPDQIKGMREGYGQQFGIADTIDAARRARLGQIGAGEEGSSVPLDKAGLIQKALTKVKGGQQYLADRNFRTAARAFEPASSTYPEPVEPDAGAIVRNRAAAEREAVHQSFLDQLAKDSAATRSEATTSYRQASKAAQGEGLRAKGRRNAIEREGR